MTSFNASIAIPWLLDIATDVEGEGCLEDPKEVVPRVFLLACLSCDTALPGLVFIYLKI